MSHRKILVADLLCGAGGSTTGCERALLELGFTLDQIEFVGVNHWQTAIDTFRMNHANVRAVVQDIATVRPHILVPEGYLDLLMASPTCTHHSAARGGKPTSDQQRSDPWHIITWLTELRVRRMIIENVWEFTKWGPVDPRTMKPIKSREGEYFWAWINALKACGMTRLEWRKLNAADYGDATTRQRFILLARSDGKRVLFPVATHTRRPDEGLALFPTMKAWRPAREIINWDHKGRSIYGRAKPLAVKTLLRIDAGAIKHGWPVGYLRRLRRHMAELGVDTSTLPPLPQQTSAAEPQIIVLRQHMDGRSVDDALPAIAAEGQHIALAEPVIGNMKKGTVPSTTDAPLPAPTTHASQFLAEPIILSQHSSGAARPTTEPLPTIMTGGAGAESHPGCARPMLVEPFIVPQGGGGVARSTKSPLATIATDGAHALISPYYGSGSGETCITSEEPLPTATAKARFGLIVPVTHSSGGPAARSTEEQIPTMTTAKGGEFALVLPITHHDGSVRARDASVDPIPTPTGANRGELALAEAHDDDEQYDILFRMLEPPELAGAMGFTSEDHAYEFAGTKTDQIKQIGNAVSVAKMKACVSAIMADAVPRRRAKPASQDEAEAA